MWGKKKPKLFEEPNVVEAEKVEETPKIIERPAPKAAASVIAAQMQINGNISSAGDLALDGVVNGDVSCALLTVGANGSVIGNIKAETATIRGKITGNVTARTILLAGSGSVDGDLTHSVLIIEEGGSFEGRSKRVADPLAEETRALEAPTQTEVKEEAGVSTEADVSPETEEANETTTEAAVTEKTLEPAE